MAIETTDAGTTITGDDILNFRVLAIRRGLRLEIETGMTMSRGANMLRAANGLMDTNHRTKRKAYEDLNARMVALGCEDLPLRK